MIKIKMKAKELVKDIKARNEAAAKENVTFRLNVKLMEQFRKVTKAEDVSMNEMIEAMIKEFLQEMDK